MPSILRGLRLRVEGRNFAGGTANPAVREELRELAGFLTDHGVDTLFLPPAHPALTARAPSGVEGPPPRDGLLPDGTGLDPFVLLGALAPLTGGLRLGCLATPADERPPALLAKVVTSLDVCSRGRAILALAPPLRSRSRPEMLAYLGEALEVAHAMLRLPAPSLSGSHFHIAEAWNEPKFPRSEPLPLGLLLAAESGARPPDLDLELDPALLDLAARSSEYCFVEIGDLSADSLDGLAAEFALACRRSGRLPKAVALCAVLGDALATSPRELTRRAGLCAEAGWDGVVTEWELGQDREGLSQHLTALAELFPGR